MRRPRSSCLLVLVVIGVVVAVPQTGTGRENCPNTCPDTVRPVCGTNNILYRNECHLFRTACASLPGLGKKNDGPCVTSAGSGSSTRCREECTKIYLPVCGTDGVTYDNECLLKVASCKNVESGRSKIEVAFENACAGFTGNSGRQPSQDSQRLPSVSSSVVSVGCPDTCTGGFRPVCGTNNITYGSNCYLELAKCRNPGLEKKADGVCTKDCSLQCDASRHLVCGSDGVTYTNDCFLLLAKCKDSSVSRKHDGACKFVEKPECVPRRCSNEGQTMCGSDGITYRNKCQFDAAVCHNQGLLKLNDGPCRRRRKQKKWSKKKSL